MTDRPILFSAPMVRALLDGRKTQTRRILKPQPDHCHRDIIGKTPPYSEEDWNRLIPQLGDKEMPLRFAKGDRLWVRETISFEHRWTGTKPRDVPAGVPVWYWADGDPTEGDWTKPIVSIHMPRWCSRITDTITDVRVQRLQEIGEEDAIAEGCAATVGENWWQGYRDLGNGGALLHQICPGDAPPDWMIEPKPAGRAAWRDKSARDAFSDLWGSINGADSWAANPWIVALTFTVERRNIDG